MMLSLMKIRHLIGGGFGADQADEQLFLAGRPAWQAGKKGED
jgi:hypothetical protein